MQFSPPENTDTKAEFRKPSNDAANRKYRRRSPASGSPSSDGSPKSERSSSPIFTGRDPAKVSEHRQGRKDDERELGRNSDRSQYGKSRDSYRYSDRHSSRNSRGYTRHDEDTRHEKHADDEERDYRESSRSCREYRGASHSDYRREESERGKSIDYVRNVDKYTHDRYEKSGYRSKDREKESASSEHQKLKDSSPKRAGSGRKHTNSTSEEDRDWYRRDRDGRNEKKDYRSGFGDHKSDRTFYHEESKGYRNDNSRRDNGGHHFRESHRSSLKEQSDHKEKKKYYDYDRGKDQYSRAQGKQVDDKSCFGNESEESSAKKPKLFGSGRDTDCSRDVSATVGNEKQSSSSKPAQETDDKVTVEQAHANPSDAANDLNAAKVAAMKAAELVNRNLGVGSMTTEQKKKLLWGNKKSTESEEAGHRWDNAMFGDRGRQEKFNKLMGVKGEVKMEHQPDQQDGTGLLQAEKQKELQMDLEKQYTAGLRRRDGRTVGLGL